MSQTENLPEKKITSLVGRLAEKYQIPAKAFLGGLRDTVFNPGKDKKGHPLKPFSDEELMAALVLADQYDLNPFANQIYIVRSHGKLLRIVPIDGWAAIVNRHPQYDGCKFEDGEDEKRGTFIECTMWHKGRTRPTTIREYLLECERPTEPWKQFPMRMLRHKAMIQCARIAFGLSGIMDDDEALAIGARVPDYSVTDSNKALPEYDAPRTRAVPTEVTPTKKTNRRKAKRKDAPASVAVADDGRPVHEQEPPPAQTELLETPTETGPTPAQLVNEISEVCIGHGFTEEEWAEVNAATGVDQITIECDIGRLEAALRKAEEIAAAKRD